MSETPSLRRDWMRTTGTPESVLTGHAIIDYVASQEWDVPIASSLNTEVLGREIDSRVAGFGKLAIDLSRQLRTVTTPEQLTRFIQCPDKPKEYLFRDGIGDQEFTWQFASYMAAQVVYRFEKDGLLTQAALTQITLSDWADVIGSEWFSNLLHDVAVAAPGTYRAIGNSPSDYIYSQIDMPTPHRQEEVWGNLPDKLFETATTAEAFVEPELDGISVTSPTATLTPAFRQALRQSVRNEGYFSNATVLLSPEITSIGCPVARNGFEIEPHYLTNFEELAARGLVAIIEKRGKTFALQVLSPIDRYLQIFAQLLVDIDNSHGTPTLEKDGLMTYAHHPKTHSFFRVSDNTDL